MPTHDHLTHHAHVARCLRINATPLTLVQFLATLRTMYEASYVAA